MPANECGSGIGGTMEGSQESPVGVSGIQGLSIKIEGGPNISAHKAYRSKQEHFALMGL